MHFSIPDESASPLRVDVMSRLRGVDAFPLLWERRTTVALSTGHCDAEVLVEVMALEDLVAARKTQRDKDWPMLRRLVDASFAAARDAAVTDAQVTFWLAELRSPAFLAEVIARHPDAAARSSRPAVRAALNGDEMDEPLAAEQAQIMAEDRTYWAPLRRELEALRHEARIASR